MMFLCSQQTTTEDDHGQVSVGRKISLPLRAMHGTYFIRSLLNFSAFPTSLHSIEHEKDLNQIKTTQKRTHNTRI